MSQSITLTAPLRLRVYTWDRVFLFLAAALASTIMLKFGQIQYLEVLYGIEMVMLFHALSERNFTTRWFRPFLRLGVFYLIFCTMALVLAVASLRFDFYFPVDLSVLKYPVVIAISRIAEIFASVFFMLYFAGEIREDPKKARFMMRVYFWTGFASALYSILSYPLNVAGIASLGTYLIDHRMRGFYNEGGPYGLYLLSVYLVGIALYREGWEPKSRLLWSFPVMFVVFLKSESKAAFLAVLAMALLNVLLLRSAVKRAVLIVSGVGLLVLMLQVVDLGRALRSYRQSSAAYERLSHLHSGDANFVLGRVAGAFIVPKMIAAHPWTGVGWGNYGILRNAPEYRGAAAWAEFADEPGLGLLGTAADLGLPLLGYLLLCLLAPLFYLRKLQAPVHLVNLALLQPVAHAFGAQLNLTYPWIVTAFALGLAFSRPQGHNVARPLAHRG